MDERLRNDLFQFLEPTFARIGRTVSATVDGAKKDFGYSRFGLLTIYASYWRDQDMEVVLSFHVQTMADGYRVWGDVGLGDGRMLKDLAVEVVLSGLDTGPLFDMARDFAANSERHTPLLIEVLTSQPAP